LNLVAIQIQTGKETSMESGRIRLAASVGRAASSSHRLSSSRALDLSFAHQKLQGREGWQEELKKLEQKAKTGQVESFSTSTLEQLADAHKTADQIAALVDLSIAAMFSIDGNSEHSASSTKTCLSLNFVSEPLLQALSSSGHLSCWRLKRALGNSTHQDLCDLIEPGDICRALYNADTTAQTMAFHLSHNSAADLQDLLGTVRFLINLVKDLTSSDDLETTTERNFDPMSSLERNTLDEDEMARQAEKIPASLRKAMIISLFKLGRLDPATFARSVRKLYSRDEVAGLIQVLRQQLFQGGHVSWLLSPAVPSHDLSKDQRQDIGDGKDLATLPFESMVTLLSACLDAIGPFPLTIGHTDQDLMEGIIPDLLSEIQLSAQYIEESAELHGMLRETLRYFQSQEAQAPEFETRIPTTDGRQKKGQIRTLYSQHANDEITDGLIGVLPLSLQDENVIGATKVRKVGGQVSSRSVREMEMQGRRAKGTYTFERLVL
jgi:hypothetical protein